MWIYVATSFTRYRKVGVAAQKAFRAELMKDGFVMLHNNLYVRYCTTGSNAAMHKERIKKVVPRNCCDVSILMIPDSQEPNTYHSIHRRHKRTPLCEKPDMVEFF